MDETIQQIETHIDRTRDELGSHLRELEGRVSAATDWREYVRARPYTTLAAAMAGGLVLATVLTKRGNQRRFRAPEPTQSRSSIDARGQAMELWEEIANALMGVAATGVKTYIGGLVPGFTEEIRRAGSQRLPSQGMGAAVPPVS
jgi:hypothetical protein